MARKSALGANRCKPFSYPLTSASVHTQRSPEPSQPTRTSLPTGLVGPLQRTSAKSPDSVLEKSTLQQPQIPGHAATHSGVPKARKKDLNLPSSSFTSHWVPGFCTASELNNACNQANPSRGHH